MTEYEIAVHIADTYMRAMSANDYTAVVALYADDAKLEDPVGSDVLEGKQAISDFYHGIGDTNLKLKRTGPVRYSNSEMVFPFECISSDATVTVKIDIIDHFILNENNFIVSMRAFWGPDTMSMLE
jgi:steroid delta-isomerase